MQKITLFLVSFLFFLGAQAQEINIEQQVADSACACLSAIDTAMIKSQSNALKMDCLQKAIAKNQESITKKMETEKRKEEDEEKIGIKGSLMIKVQNILAVKCPAYQLFEKKVQERRGP